MWSEISAVSESFPIEGQLVADDLATYMLLFALQHPIFIGVRIAITLAM